MPLGEGFDPHQALGSTGTTLQLLFPQLLFPQS